MRILFIIVIYVVYETSHNNMICYLASIKCSEYEYSVTDKKNKFITNIYQIKYKS